MQDTSSWSCCIICYFPRSGSLNVSLKSAPSCVQGSNENSQIKTVSLSRKFKQRLDNTYVCNLLISKIWFLESSLYLVSATEQQSCCLNSSDSVWSIKRSSSPKILSPSQWHCLLPNYTLFFFFTWNSPASCALQEPKSRLCKRRHTRTRIRTARGEPFHSHHWVSTKRRGPTRSNMMRKHRLCSLLQKLHIMDKWVPWPTWRWAAKIWGWTAKIGNVSTATLHNKLKHQYYTIHVVSHHNTSKMWTYP